MAAPYSQDLRDRVLAAYDDGLKSKQIADLFNVSPAWVCRVKQSRREHGETSPRSMGGVTIIKIDMDRLAALVRKKPDAALLERIHSVKCIWTVLCVFCHDADLGGASCQNVVVGGQARFGSCSPVV